MTTPPRRWRLHSSPAPRRHHGTCVPDPPRPMRRLIHATNCTCRLCPRRRGRSAVPGATRKMQPPRPRRSSHGPAPTSPHGLRTPPGPDPAENRTGVAATPRWATKRPLPAPPNVAILAQLRPLAGRRAGLSRASTAPKARCRGRLSRPRAWEGRAKQRGRPPWSPGRASYVTAPHPAPPRTAPLRVP